MKNRLQKYPVWLLKTKFLWLVSSFLLVSWPLLLFASESRYYKEAKDYYDQKQYLMAMLSAQKALEENPNNANHIFFYGLVLTELEQFTEAKQHLQKAVSLQPDNAEFHYRLAALLLREKIALKAMLSLDGRDENTLLVTGTEKEAINSLKKAVSLNPNHFKARLHLGRAYYDQNLHDLARQQFLDVSEKNPSYPWLHYHIAMLYSNVGNVQEAIKELEGEIELYPEHAQAQLELGELFLKVSRFELALKHLLNTNEREVNPADLHYALAKVYRNLGDREKAINLAKKCLKVDSQFADAHYLLGQIYREIGQMELSRESMELFQKLKTTKEMQKLNEFLHLFD